MSDMLPLGDVIGKELEAENKTTSRLGITPQTPKESQGPKAEPTTPQRADRVNKKPSSQSVSITYLRVINSKLIKGDCIVVENKEHKASVIESGNAGELPIFTMKEIHELSGDTGLIATAADLKRVFREVRLIKESSDIVPPSKQVEEAFLPFL